MLTCIPQSVFTKIRRFSVLKKRGNPLTPHRTVRLCGALVVLALCAGTVSAQKPQTPPAGQGYFGGWKNPHVPVNFPKGLSQTEWDACVAVGGLVNPSTGDTSGVACSAYLLEQTVGRKLAVHLHYYGWGDISSLMTSSSWPDPQIQDDLNNNRIPMISWQCDGTGPQATDPGTGVTSSDYAVVVNSTDQQIVLTTAQALARLNVPVFLRWFWEPNGSGAGANALYCRGDSGNPGPGQFADFKLTFQYIANAMHTNAPNVNMMFGLMAQNGVIDPPSGIPSCQTATPGDPTCSAQIADAMYPGDSYVDWISLDRYDRGTSITNLNSGPCTFAYTNTDPYCDLWIPYNTMASHNKPIFVAENGAINSGDALASGADIQAPYLGQLSTYLTSANNPFPLLRGYSYFDSFANWDWALDDDANGTTPCPVRAPPNGGGCLALKQLGATSFFAFTGGGPPDFSLSVSPSSATVTAGQSGTSTISVSPLNGYSGTVNLSVSGTPAGVTASFNPASILGGSGSSTLTLATTSSAAPGTYSITVKGIGSTGLPTHSATISLTINVAPPDFTVAVTPSSQSGPAGGNVNFTVTITTLNGFSGTVSLSAVVQNVAGNINPANWPVTFTPSSVTPPSQTATTMNVTIGRFAPHGAQASVTVTGTSGALQHTVSPVYVNVP